MDQLGFRLYLITDRAASTRPPLEVVEECLDAGLRAVQLREKDLEVRALLALAEPLREATRRHGARLLINDRADVALAVGADGMQRTHTSLPVAALRGITLPGFLIGASAHSTAEAREAVAEGADFVVFGPVYDTPSKRRYGPPQGLAALEAAAAAVVRPVLAVGGITPERVPEVRAAGAAGVAVIGAVYGAARPADATKAFLDVLGSA
ncbi:MAG: thiamine phosphate synthase [Candidatus Rokuibacteriota bacterium]